MQVTRKDTILNFVYIYDMYYISVYSIFMTVINLYVFINVLFYIDTYSES